jgi:hypothetical protein
MNLFILKDRRESMTDCEIIEFIEDKIVKTTGEDQEEWVRKYDVFTSKKFFEKYNRLEDLKEVEKIKNEVKQILGA